MYLSQMFFVPTMQKYVYGLFTLWGPHWTLTRVPLREEYKMLPAVCIHVHIKSE